MEEFQNLTDKQKKRLLEFLKEAIYLTDEENAAIEHQLPMTQELFEHCIEHCTQIGAYFRTSCLIEEYPHFYNNYLDKEATDITNVNIPEITQDDIDASWQRFKAKILDKHKNQIPCTETLHQLPHARDKQDRADSNYKY